MGHEGYQTEAYRRYSEKELADFYKNGEHVLWLSQPSPELEHRTREVEKNVVELQKENQSLREEMSRMRLTAIVENERQLRDLVDEEIRKREKGKKG